MTRRLIAVTIGLAATVSFLIVPAALVMLGVAVMALTAVLLG